MKDVTFLLLVFAGVCLFLFNLHSLLKHRRYLNKRKADEQPVFGITSPVVIHAFPTFKGNKINGADVIVWRPESSEDLRRLHKDWNEDRINRTTYFKRLKAIKCVDRRVYKTLSLGEWEELAALRNKAADLILLQGFLISSKPLIEKDFDGEPGPDTFKPERITVGDRIREILCIDEILSKLSKSQPA